MTHKQTWTEIALAFHTPEGEGAERQRKLAIGGLCWAADTLMGYGKVLSFYKLCKALMLPGAIVWWFPPRCWPAHRREYDLIRGDMAMLFACMTEKEFNKLLRNR